MKKIQLLLLTILSLNSGFSQQEKPNFPTIDTVQRESGTVVYEGVFNVDYLNSHYLFDNNHQYWFRIPEANIKQAYSTILNVELTEPENGLYEKMGNIFCSEIHAPSTKKDVLYDGTYVDAWGFKVNIEVWYNGDYIRLIYPALGKNTIKSLEHAFYIKAADYKKVLNAFTPKKQQNEN